MAAAQGISQKERAIRDGCQSREEPQYKSIRGSVVCRNSHTHRKILRTALALQLPICFEVRALSGSQVSSAPERPCDDVCGLDPLSSESDGDAADFLD